MINNFRIPICTSSYTTRTILNSFNKFDLDYVNSTVLTVITISLFFFWFGQNNYTHEIYYPLNQVLAKSYTRSLNLSVAEIRCQRFTIKAFLGKVNG